MADRICGPYETILPSGEIVNHIWLAPKVYIIEDGVIDESKYQQGGYHCITYDSVIDTTADSYGLTRITVSGARFESYYCPSDCYLSISSGVHKCLSCGAHKAGMPLTQDQVYQRGVGFMHQNTTCDYCSSGYYRDSSSCIACPSVTSDMSPTGAFDYVASFGMGIDACYFVFTNATGLHDDSGTYDVIGQNPNGVEGIGFCTWVQ